MDLSVIIPVYEEEENLPRLIPEIHGALAGQDLSYEIICVDDGSQDRSLSVLEEMASLDKSLVILSFRRNFGQTAAMQAGLDAARGERVALMDADLQNDPADIPRMLKVSKRLRPGGRLACRPEGHFPDSTTALDHREPNHQYGHKSSLT